MSNPLKKLIKLEHVGIASVCSSNEYVIRSTMQSTKEINSYILIESTSNQVNQFGGYTGQTPQDFKDFVLKIAKEESFPKDKILLGGDHLGPLIWTNIENEEAMSLAETLVYDYAKAGFDKIHLDTSMRLRDDDTSSQLKDITIAKRGARLAKSVENGFKEYQKNNPDASFPVLIVGSEVPIPGGAQEEETIEVTNPDDLDNTIKAYEEAFDEYGIPHLFDHVIAAVVQPGVEFGDNQIDRYNRQAAKNLVDHVKENYPQFVLEGHSTDYQNKFDLKAMVEDRISILKVGPGLTFAFREAVYNFASVEENLSLEKTSDYIKVVDDVMLENPDNWKKHYHGSKVEQAFKRKYSFSDRSRYYFNVEAVQKSFKLLKDNINNNDVPLPLLSQFFPVQYKKHIEGDLEFSFDSFVLDYIDMAYQDYLYATNQGKL